MLQSGKRERKSRITLVDGAGTGYGGAVPVLNSNQYELGQSTSVFDQEFGGRSIDRASYGVVKRKLLIAGRDYAHEQTCLACFGGFEELAQPSDPSELLCCKQCPMAFHPACAKELGLQLVASGLGAPSFVCPHHACQECGRKAGACGGLIFRCEVCPASFCEDHLPADVTIVGTSARLEERGIPLPTQACYVHCSPKCAGFMAKHFPAEEHEMPYEPLDLASLSDAPPLSAANDAAPPVASTSTDAAAAPSGSSGGDDVAMVPADAEEEAAAPSVFTKLFGQVLASQASSALLMGLVSAAGASRVPLG